MTVKVCILLNNLIHGYCFVYLGGQLISVDYYQDGQLIRNLTAYVKNKRLPNDNLGRNGYTRTQVDFTGYMFDGKPIPNTYA